MAAQNPPSLVLVVLRRERSLVSRQRFPETHSGHLATAYFMTASMAALGDYWSKLTAMYGEPDGAWLGVATLHPESLGGLTGKASVQPVPALVHAAVERCADALGA